jgi:hypothetical protein
VSQQPREDPKPLRTQIDQFGKLLRSKAALSERHDILPFIEKRPNLAALIGSFVNEIGVVTDYALEYPIYGDFTADLVVGNRTRRRFCLIEFEDGQRDSIFKTPAANRRPSGAPASSTASPRSWTGSPTSTT